MPKFSRSGKKDMPEIGTSSDIVFMFLFFFMVTTQLRKTENMVMVKLPEARDKQAQYGTDARIQLNDSFKTVDDIRDFIAAERESKSEADRQFMTVSIKADENVRMGIISDVKQELRRCSALKIMYAARRAEK